MYALPSPSRRLPRFPIRTALLALALTAIVLMAGAARGARDGSPAGSASPPPAPEVVRVPLAPPTVFDRPLRSPLSRLSPAP